MGDILHALPAVTALRQAHPNWEIGWVVEPRWRGLLAAPGVEVRGAGMPVPLMPIIDRLHFAPTREWASQPIHPKTAAAIGSLRKELLAAGYDAVLDLQGSIRSATIARMAKIKRVIGEAEPREKPARWLFTERIVTHGAHVIEQDIELASAVAGDELAFTWRSFLSIRQPRHGATTFWRRAARVRWRSSIPARGGAPSVGRWSATPRSRAA